MSKKVRVVKVKSFKELPEVVRPGTYVINGSKVVVEEPIRRSTLKVLVKYGRYFSRKYGPSD